MANKNSILGRSKFINAPIANPTQNSYFRFVGRVDAPPDSLFTDSQNNFSKIAKDNLKNVYSEYLTPFGE